jgi:HSP20 family protein
MGILRRDGNEQRQRRNEQNALTRSEQPQVMREPYQMTRDPYQMMLRDPFQLMREMMIDPFRVFQQMTEAGGRELMWNPSFEVRETDDAFVFKGDMPGVRDQDLDVSLSGNNLTITGKRERDVEHDEGTLHTYERSYGQFTRYFTLPESADVDQIRCDLKDGVLSVVVPKRPGSSPQKRKIQIGSGTKA